MPTPIARLLPVLLAALLLGGCETLGLTSPREPGSVRPREAAQANLGPEDLYSQGLVSLRGERYGEAVEFFELVERDHPYSTWAVNARLMSGYAEYSRNRYTEALGQLDRFIQLHPAHRDIAYAYYLRSLCYYEQIADAQRDQAGTETAMAALQEVVNRFPNTPYARDARLKMDLARDHMAGKEMNVGRFYQARGLNAAAIGRFRRVVDDYQTTNHVPEALHRLTEIYVSMGLTDEARRTASVLGYNYPGSSWYQDSYALLGGETGAAAPRENRNIVRRALDSVF